MIKTTIAVVAMTLGLAVHTAHATDNHQHGAQQATPAKAAEVKGLGGSGQACKNGKCGEGKGAGMQSCCCSHMMGKMDMMQGDGHGGMDQEAMMERMHMMEKRMDMMQMMMERMSTGAAGAMPAGK
jgi:hypothetical protein